jgi:hypothetical protein
MGKKGFNDHRTDQVSVANNHSHPTRQTGGTMTIIRNDHRLNQRIEREIARLTNKSCIEGLHPTFVDSLLYHDMQILVQMYSYKSVR